MKEQLSHTEIERLIDEQERELDILLRNYSRRESGAATTGAAGGAQGRSRGLMGLLRSLFRRPASSR